MSNRTRRAASKYNTIISKAHASACAAVKPEIAAHEHRSHTQQASDKINEEI